MNSAEALLRYDPADPAFNNDPHPTLARFRREAPVYYWEAGKGYVFFRHRDVHALLREPRLSHDPTLGAGFPAEIKRAFPDFAAVRENDLFSASAADHGRLRRLVNPLFNPRAVEAHRPKVLAIVRELLDTLPSEGVINVSRDFARRYPVRVIASMLHIPVVHEGDFMAFADALIATVMPHLPPDVFASYMPAISRGTALVRACIADRRARPLEGDLLTQLIQARDEAEKLSEAELLALVAALLVGGSDTTTHLTTYAIMELHSHPDQLALLRAEPQLARGAIDETLRFNMFARGAMTRFAVDTFEYQGIRLVRGMPVYLQSMAAFRDPEFFENPDIYDIRRPVTTSPWFGFGPHFCLGVSLARMEAEIALQSFLAKYPQTELAGAPEYGFHPLMRDILNLPIRVSVGPQA